jgi:hypothetical protein
MKTVRRFGVTSVFSLVLATATFAGEISTPKAPPPPPPAASSALTPGDIQNPQGASDSVTDIALQLLQTMLSVF